MRFVIDADAEKPPEKSSSPGAASVSGNDTVVKAALPSLVVERMRGEASRGQRTGPRFTLDRVFAMPGKSPSGVDRLSDKHVAKPEQVADDLGLPASAAGAVVAEVKRGILAEPNEVTFRKNLTDVMRQHGLDDGQRKVALSRALTLFRKREPTSSDLLMRDRAKGLRMTTAVKSETTTFGIDLSKGTGADNLIAPEDREPTDDEGDDDEETDDADDDAEKSFASDWLEQVDALVKAEDFAPAADLLLKGAGHKYLKRTGAQGSYRYTYSAAAASLSGKDAKVGDKFRMSSQESGKKGHYEVTHDHGDGNVTIRHDETGATSKLSRDELHQHVASEHKVTHMKAAGKAVAAWEKANNKGDHASAGKFAEAAAKHFGRAEEADGAGKLSEHWKGVAAKHKALSGKGPGLPPPDAPGPSPQAPAPENKPTAAPAKPVETPAAKPDTVSETPAAAPKNALLDAAKAKATAASAEAQKTGTRDAHGDAGYAHTLAAEHAKIGGDKAAAEAHSATAQEHYKKMDPEGAAQAQAKTEAAAAPKPAKPKPMAFGVESNVALPKALQPQVKSPASAGAEAASKKAAEVEGDKGSSKQSILEAHKKADDEHAYAGYVAKQSGDEKAAGVHEKAAAAHKQKMVDVNAKDAPAEARAATHKAITSGKSEDHQAASAAHRRAAGLLKMKSKGEGEDPKVGDTATAQHETAADQHHADAHFLSDNKSKHDSILFKQPKVLPSTKTLNDAVKYDKADGKVALQGHPAGSPAIKAGDLKPGTIANYNGTDGDHVITQVKDSEKKGHVEVHTQHRETGQKDVKVVKKDKLVGVHAGHIKDAGEGGGDASGKKGAVDEGKGGAAAAEKPATSSPKEEAKPTTEQKANSASTAPKGGVAGATDPGTGKDISPYGKKRLAAQASTEKAQKSDSYDDHLEASVDHDEAAAEAAKAGDKHAESLHNKQANRHRTDMNTAKDKPSWMKPNADAKNPNAEAGSTKEMAPGLTEEKLKNASAKGYNVHDKSGKKVLETMSKEGAMHAHAKIHGKDPVGLTPPKEMVGPVGKAKKASNQRYGIVKTHDGKAVKPSPWDTYANAKDAEVHATTAANRHRGQNGIKPLEGVGEKTYAHSTFASAYEQHLKDSSGKKDDVKDDTKKSLADWANADPLAKGLLPIPVSPEMEKDKAKAEHEQREKAGIKTPAEAAKDTVIEKGTGEGSRGGKVIGHTGSGKPVYENYTHASSHKTFTAQDHRDAAKAWHSHADALGANSTLPNGDRNPAHSDDDDQDSLHADDMGEQHEMHAAVKDAHEASKKALASGKPEDHKAAATAHDAASKQAKGIGEEEIADRHAEVHDMHMQAGGLTEIKDGTDNAGKAKAELQARYGGMSKSDLSAWADDDEPDNLDDGDDTMDKSAPTLGDWLEKAIPGSNPSVGEGPKIPTELPSAAPKFGQPTAAGGDLDGLGKNEGQPGKGANKQDIGGNPATGTATKLSTDDPDVGDIASGDPHFPAMSVKLPGGDRPFAKSQAAVDFDFLETQRRDNAKALAKAKAAATSTPEMVKSGDPMCKACGGKIEKAGGVCKTCADKVSKGIPPPMEGRMGLVTVSNEADRLSLASMQEGRGSFRQPSAPSHTTSSPAIVRGDNKVFIEESRPTHALFRKQPKVLHPK